eukprot:TRINITY_DN6585_c0_g1_i7.p1 TRINITY_DN6585_c0_g1~~TRINITY_DN6585_c0_g1_i7.p1  ORF type:complete len:131 (+),score=37.33 TRINITY_DN6585_c0_g1_i7:1-393(+)
MLRKNISDDFVSIRSQLTTKRRQMGEPPFTAQNMQDWHKLYEKLEKNDVQDVNKKINNYNLIVPMLSSQMFQFNLKNEAKKILDMDAKSLEDSCFSEADAGSQRPEPLPVEPPPEKGFFREILDSLFKPR